MVDMPSSGRYLPTERDFDSNFVSQNRVKRQTKVISTPRYGGPMNVIFYRDRLKSVQILLSRTQAGPGRRVRQE